MLGNTLVTPPSVEANTARKPYLHDGGKAVFCSDTLLLTVNRNCEALGLN